MIAFNALDVALGTLKYAASYSHSISCCPLFVCLTEVFQTDPVPYNNLKVNIDKDINAVKSSGTITWTVSGGTAVSYSYFLKPASGYRWIDTFQQDVTRVEEELYLNPGLYYFGSSNTPSISTSQITESGEQILIVTAVDADGNISKADSWTFTY